MHDEMLNHFDECITRMLLLRDQLAAARRVEPGERHEIVLAAIAAAERFAFDADQTLTNTPSPVRVIGPTPSTPVFLGSSAPILVLTAADPPSSTPP